MRAFSEARTAILADVFDAPDVAADWAAVAADVWSQDRKAPTADVAPPEHLPPEHLMEALAEAMAAKPRQRITDRDQAMAYFRAQDRRRLASTNDPMVRGLLLGTERHWTGTKEARSDGECDQSQSYRS